MKMDRKIILNKFQGHCAYCGCQISMDDMQVDHIIPKWKGGSDAANNLNPSCRMCNFYKGGNDIETFRKRLIVELDYKRTFATRLALRYGILTENNWDGKFYYEKVRES